MTKREAEMLAKNWRLGNKFRKKSLTKKYDLKPATSGNTGRVKMGIRIDVENNPKNYKAALDDDGSLVFFTGNPMKRVQVSDLFVPPKATRKVTMKDLQTNSINYKLRILETAFPNENKYLLEAYLIDHDVDINNFSILEHKPRIKAYKDSIEEMTEYQLVAQKVNGDEVKSKFYKTENELADMQHKCEESEEYESTTVIKRITGVDEAGLEYDNQSEQQLGLSNFRKLSDQERQDLFDLTNLALRQVPQSPKQKATIAKINKIRAKGKMALLKSATITAAEEVSESVNESKILDNMLKKLKGSEKSVGKKFVDMLKKKGDAKKIAKEFKKFSGKTKDEVMKVLSDTSVQDLLQNGEVVKQLATMYDEVGSYRKLDGRSKEFRSKVKKLEYNKKKKLPYELYGESTKAYGDSLRKIAKDRQLKMLTKKDREALDKIAKLLAKEEMYDPDKDHTKDPKSHVKLNKKTGMYCVYDMKGKKHAEFKTKEEAEAYSIKHHDKLMNESFDIQEKLPPGKIDGRTLAGKIITGEVKLLTVKQGSPGQRGTYIMATGRPSSMGAPPDSIYIDATGARPKGSGLAVGFKIDQIQKAEILRDGSARVELK
jgi:hypothetical protein